MRSELELTIVEQKQREQDRHPLLLNAPVPHRELPQGMSKHTLRHTEDKIISCPALWTSQFFTFCSVVFAQRLEVILSVFRLAPVLLPSP